MSIVLYILYLYSVPELAHKNILFYSIRAWSEDTSAHIICIVHIQTHMIRPLLLQHLSISSPCWDPYYLRKSDPSPQACHHIKHLSKWHNSWREPQCCPTHGDSHPVHLYCAPCDIWQVPDALPEMWMQQLVQAMIISCLESCNFTLAGQTPASCCLSWAQPPQNVTWCSATDPLPSTERSEI